MRILRLGAIPAGLALGLYAEWAAVQRGPLQEAASAADVRLAVADLVVGMILIGCGVAAWIQRPMSRIGLLLALAGGAWFLGTFAGSGQSSYQEFGALFVTLHRGPLVHALLAYPSGRLERWGERAAVALAYVVSAVAEVGNASEGRGVLAVVVLVIGSQRLVAASGPARRARRVAATASAAFAVVLLVSALTDVAGSGPSLERGVLWAYQVVVAAVALGLAVDLVLGRWVQATVTGLVVDLGEVDGAGTLRDRLAKALGDRSLRVGYWLPERGVYVDDQGREVDLPAADGDRSVTIVREGGDPVAVLVHDAGVLTDPELARSVAAAARIAVANARLQAEVRRQIQDLEASRRRLLEAGDAERRRLERELREGAEGRLGRLETLLDAAGRRADGALAAIVAETRSALERTRSELGEFARGVHPRLLVEEGLAPALRELAGRSDVPVQLAVPGDRYPPAVEAASYFVCSEALANAGKYAAASRIAVEVVERDGTLAVSVRDDGLGGATFAAGSGLRGLADRVEAVGGRLTVTSPPGEGTTIVAELPLA